MNANLNFRSNGHLLISKLSRLLAIIVLGASVSAFQCGWGGGNSGSGNSGGNGGSRGWRVWIRTEPCPGRFDWLSVSKEQPGGGSGAGLGTYWLYDNFLPRQEPACTEAEPFGCTFAEAEALREKLRSHPKFLDICCKNYSVWKKTQTGEMSVVLGNFGTAGGGFEFVKGNLCCEEAEAIAGKPGVCSGSTHVGNTGNTGNTGCAKDYYVYEEVRTGKRYVTTGRFTTSEMHLLNDEKLCCKEAEDLAGTPGACSGKTFGGNTTGGEAKIGYIGCFKDTQPFDLDGYLEAGQNNTPERCVAICRDKGFAYAGVQNGQSCLCGNSYGRYGAATNCDVKCTGDNSQNCGGFSANSIYGTGASGGDTRGSGGGDPCSCKNNCPDCAGLPSLLCVVEGESEKARACRQCMNRCQNGQ